MPSPPIRVSFTKCSEIRMGSPHQTCRVKLAGAWKPELPDDAEFVPFKAWNEARTHLGLVRWNTAGNEPGFHVVSISVPARQLLESPRIRGFCLGLKWVDDGWLYWTQVVQEKLFRVPPSHQAGSGAG